MWVLLLKLSLLGSLLLAQLSAAQEPLQSKWLTVSGGSMSPRYEHGDTVKVDFSAYHSEQIMSGDVVSVSVASSTNGDTTTQAPTMLKQVVAIAGDRVLIGTNSMTVNGAVIDMLTHNSVVLQTQLKHYANVVPENTVLILGENQALSYDSRQLGLISAKQIIGKVVAHQPAGVRSRHLSLTK